MSWQAAATGARAWRGWPRPLDIVLSRKAVELIAIVAGALFFAYAFLAVEYTLQGKQTYQFGDFFALWTSAVVTHGGEAAVNFDPVALHLRQVALGMNPEGLNPFPYPPTVLLALGPLGALPLKVAFYLFMVPAFAAYLAAMGAGRWRVWPWTLAACIAPASAITLISGQTGFLTGALMVGGLRLLPARPALAGVLFGLLACKPQLGVLVPVALVAMRSWRAIAAAAATFALGALASGALYGFPLWAAWLRAMVEYATRFHPIVAYMPTIYANAKMLGAPRLLAWALQLAVSIPVALVVWRAFRQGPSARAAALLIVGTFLATPHAFNYDMPMLTAALVWYLLDRLAGARAVDLGEAVALLFAFALPFLMLALKGANMPMSFAPLGLMFSLIAWPRELGAAAGENISAVRNRPHCAA